MRYKTDTFFLNKQIIMINSFLKAMGFMLQYNCCIVILLVLRITNFFRIKNIVGFIKKTHPCPSLLPQDQDDKEGNKKKPNSRVEHYAQHKLYLAFLLSVTVFKICYIKKFTTKRLINELMG